MTRVGSVGLGLHLVHPAKHRRRGRYFSTGQRCGFWGHGPMHGASAVYVYIFEPISSASARPLGLNPVVRPAGVLRQCAPQKQSGTGNERRIQLDPVSVLFAVYVESEVVRFFSSLPRKHYLAGASFVSAGVCCERLQLNLGCENNRLGLTG